MTLGSSRRRGLVPGHCSLHGRHGGVPKSWPHPCGCSHLGSETAHGIAFQLKRKINKLRKQTKPPFQNRRAQKRKEVGRGATRFCEGCTKSLVGPLPSCPCSAHPDAPEQEMASQAQGSHEPPPFRESSCGCPGPWRELPAMSPTASLCRLGSAEALGTCLLPWLLNLPQALCQSVCLSPPARSQPLVHRGTNWPEAGGGGCQAGDRPCWEHIITSTMFCGSKEPQCIHPGMGEPEHTAQEMRWAWDHGSHHPISPVCTCALAQCPAA